MLSNGTWSGGKISHIGPVFFDQSLISQIETLSLSHTNKQTLTTNAADRVKVIASGVCFIFSYHIYGLYNMSVLSQYSRLPVALIPSATKYPMAFSHASLSV